MILLITASSTGQHCAHALQAATGLKTQWASSLQEAVGCLREQTYSVAVIDQFLLENEPAESDQMTQHLGSTFPVYLNFAVTGMERLVREVRLGLHRRRREEEVARRTVSNEMRSAMYETVTALLLSCELAMSIPEVPVPAVERIRAIDGLARDLRSRLNAH